MEKVFYSWMNEIEPWCISRQIIGVINYQCGTGQIKKFLFRQKEANEISRKYYKKSSCAQKLMS